MPEEAYRQAPRGCWDARFQPAHPAAPCASCGDLATRLMPPTALRSGATLERDTAIIVGACRQGRPGPVRLFLWAENHTSTREVMLVSYIDDVEVKDSPVRRVGLLASL